MALIVHVPVLPEVVKVPAVAVGAGPANASVGGNTSRYCTWNAVRGPLLRAVMVKVPVEPTMVGGLSVLYALVTPKSALKGVPPLAQPAPSVAAVAGAAGKPAYTPEVLAPVAAAPVKLVTSAKICVPLS